MKLIKVLCIAALFGAMFVVDAADAAVRRIVVGGPRARLSVGRASFRTGPIRRVVRRTAGLRIGRSSLLFGGQGLRRQQIVIGGGYYQQPQQIVVQRQSYYQQPQQIVVQREQVYQQPQRVVVQREQVYQQPQRVVVQREQVCQQPQLQQEEVQPSDGCYGCQSAAIRVQRYAR